MCLALFDLGEDLVRHALQYDEIGFRSDGQHRLDRAAYVEHGDEVHMLLRVSLILCLDQKLEYFE